MSTKVSPRFAIEENNQAMSTNIKPKKKSGFGKLLGDKVKGFDDFSE